MDASENYTKVSHLATSIGCMNSSQSFAGFSIDPRTAEGEDQRTRGGGSCCMSCGFLDVHCSGGTRTRHKECYGGLPILYGGRGGVRGTVGVLPEGACGIAAPFPDCAMRRRLSCGWCVPAGVHAGGMLRP